MSSFSKNQKHFLTWLLRLRNEYSVTLTSFYELFEDKTAKREILRDNLYTLSSKLRNKRP